MVQSQAQKAQKQKEDHVIVNRGLNIKEAPGLATEIYIWMRLTTESAGERGW